MKLYTILIASIVIGCTPRVNVDENSMLNMSYTVSKNPDFNTIRTVRVGEEIYFEEKYITESNLVTDDPISETFGLGATVRLPRGSELVRSTVGGRSAYCSNQASYTEPLGSGPSRSTCFFDNNSDGKLDEFWVAGTLESTSRSLEPVSVSISSKQLGTEGFRKELIYQGVDGNTLRIKYREFTDNLARPAFSQDLTYTAENIPTTLRFRSVEIDILDVSGSEIEYEIINGFE